MASAHRIHVRGTQSTRFRIGEAFCSFIVSFPERWVTAISMNSNIILIGFMGCGKTSIGRRLAGQLGHEFHDTDVLISAHAGLSISEIFALEGEEGFRGRETLELKKLADGGCNRLVLATGGGAILKAENREILRKLGLVIWLHSDSETLFERSTRNRKRPLLDVENPRGTFLSLLESRLPLYGETAALTVNASGLTHEQTIEKILHALEGVGAPSAAGNGHGS